MIGVLLVAFAAVQLWSECPQAVAAEIDKPNIVLLLADDVRVY